MRSVGQVSPNHVRLIPKHFSAANGLMKRNMHLDDLLTGWEFNPSTLNVRLVKGKDGRDVIQMRVDMGILQLETTGRPDGEQSHWRRLHS